MMFTQYPNPCVSFPFSLQICNAEKLLAKWTQDVDELRNQYHWLLFFSMPKMLRLNHLLREKNPNVEAIVHEISFLCRNDQAAWENAQVVVEVSSGWSETVTRGLGGMQPRMCWYFRATRVHIEFFPTWQVSLHKFVYH